VHSPEPHPSEALQQIYNCSPGELPSIQERYKRLVDHFNSLYTGTQARFIVRAPGRVNLIGEHTDYSGYPVLPMAIGRDFVFVVSPQSDRSIELLNEDDRFARKEFDAKFPLPPFQQGDWGNYVKAAVHGVLEVELVDRERAVGFQALVGGTIPESAGLSSSSALVVASALAFLKVNGIQFDRSALADMLAHAERYVGSEGGGMDQAVSMLAEAGKALRIDFFPLRTKTVELPKGITFVVCNSLIRAPKSETVRYAYNRRVIECRLAGALLSKSVSKETGKSIKAIRLADVSAKHLGMDPKQVERLALMGIGENPLSMTDIAQRLDESVETVEREYCRLRDGSVLKEPPEGFKVWNRYRHVVSEAGRVDAAEQAFQVGTTEEIGALMNQSHASCRDDYEISCPELEELISISRRHGAVGARLTGAGFGGCTVNAVPSDSMGDFMRGVIEDYYHGFVNQQAKTEFTAYRDLNEVIFPCRATMGASAWPAEEIVG
jgi:N-acetylgalactosamine kinase